MYLGIQFVEFFVSMSNLVLILGHIEFLNDFAFDRFSAHLCII